MNSERTVHRLTPQETKVAQLLADGLTQDQIAKELDIAWNTVKIHMGWIRYKSGKATTVGAICWWIRNNVVKLEPDTDRLRTL